MRRFLVGGCSVGVPIDLHEHESRWIVLLLDNIEAGDAGFFEAFAGIDQRRLFEGTYAFGFDVNMNVNNQHDLISF